MTETSLIPFSPALGEAQPDSLTELFSRDPENNSRRDRDRIVAELCAMRARYETTDAAGQHQPSPLKLSKKSLLSSTSANPEDLGL